MMISNQNFQAILALDFEQIKAKLMRADGEGWSEHKANLVEIEYRRFLHMMTAFPDEMLTPLEDVDTFWHYHILDTMKYAADCEAAFGYFVHHFPYFGMRGEEDEAVHQMAGQRMHELYEEAFGESYASVATAMARADRAIKANAKPAYCTKADAKPAFCIKADAKPAFCIKAEAKPAFCIKADAQPAFCIKADPKPAFCIKAEAKPAFCIKAEAKPAFCIKAEAKPAFCIKADAKPAFCIKAAAGSAATAATASA